MTTDLIPVDLWREIASHLKEREVYHWRMAAVVGRFGPGRKLRPAPGSDVVGPLPFPKAHQDLVHLSSTCKYLRNVLGEDVKSSLTLELTVLDGKIIHTPNRHTRMATRIQPIPMHKIPAGPHIRRLCVRLRAVPDVWDTPRKPALLDSIPGSIGSRIREMHDRRRERELQDVRNSTSTSDQTATLELIAPLIATMPNIQNMYLETSIGRPRSSRTCYIGDKLMESLIQLRELTMLHLMYIRIGPDTRTLPAVRYLQSNCQVMPLKHCFPNLKDIRIVYPGHHPYYTGAPLKDSLEQLEVLHYTPSNTQDTFSFLVSFIQPQANLDAPPRFAMRELVINGCARAEDIILLINALASAPMEVFVCYGLPHVEYSRTVEVGTWAVTTWPRLMACVIGDWHVKDANAPVKKWINSRGASWVDRDRAPRSPSEASSSLSEASSSLSETSSLSSVVSSSFSGAP